MGLDYCDACCKGNRLSCDHDRSCNLPRIDSEYLNSCCSKIAERVSHLEELVTGNTTNEPPQDKVVVVTLTNTERRIINRLEDNGGEMGQDELRRATGLSKSTLSVTLTTLERKSLVSRVDSGRTKRVILEQKITR